MTREEFVAKALAELMGYMVDAILHERNGAASWLWLRQKEATLKSSLANLYDALHPRPGPPPPAKPPSGNNATPPQPPRK